MIINSITLSFISTNTCLAKQVWQCTPLISATCEAGLLIESLLGQGNKSLSQIFKSHGVSAQLYGSPGLNPQYHKQTNEKICFSNMRNNITRTQTQKSVTVNSMYIMCHFHLMLILSISQYSITWVGERLEIKSYSFNVVKTKDIDYECLPE